RIIGCFTISIVVAVCGLAACSREAAPAAAREVSSQSKVAATPPPPAAPVPPVHSGAAGAEHGSWAVAGDSIPEALHEPCDKVHSLVRSVVTSAPPDTKIDEFAGPRPIRFNYS